MYNQCIINVKFNPYYAFKGFAGSTRGGTGNTVVPVGTDYTASLRSQTVIYSVICFIILTVASLFGNFFATMLFFADSFSHDHRIKKRSPRTSPKI